ncbi:MAG: glycosyltransferase [Anaerolineae bacterium]|nr:glycosyltransferase [Anaerolineae bacterium]MDW8171533.1 glycosyltransferase [Anaerolineae bacterium]
MRVVVLSEIVAGSMFAHAVNTVNMAQGFAQAGHDVTFITQRGLPRLDDLRARYGLSQSFRWWQVRGLARVAPFLPESWRYTAQVLARLPLIRPQVVFTRAYLAPLWTARLGYPTIAETHAAVGYESPAFSAFLRATRLPAFRALVTIAPDLADYYVARGVPREKIVILPTGVDVSRWRPPTQLPPSPYDGPGPHIVYSGHLYDYKGIPAMLEAARLLPECQFHLVGGTDRDVARQRQRAVELGLSNLVLHGLKSQSELPPYLWHADVLLLPPSAQHPSARWTSPVKLGEYLASGRPIVATDIAALRHWLSEDEVRFCSPDDGAALAQAVRAALAHPPDPAKALAKAESFSYVNRAQALLSRL